MRHGSEGRQGWRDKCKTVKCLGTHFVSSLEMCPLLYMICFSMPCKVMILLERMGQR